MAVNSSNVVGLVFVMLCRCELVGQMALRAYVARLCTRYKFERVRVVTIAAGYACPVHAALNKRTIHIDLVTNLSVVEIQGSIE